MAEENNAVLPESQPESTAPQGELLSRAEFERLLAERETRWQAQLAEFKRDITPDVPAVQLRGQPNEQPGEQFAGDPAVAETDAERRTREDKAAQRTRAAEQTRQAVEGFGTTGTLPVSGSAAPHNPLAHIDDPRELYRLARRDLEQGRKSR